MRLGTRILAVATALASLSAGGMAQAQDTLRPDQAAFRALYKELVETDTSITTGSCTLLADKVERHLRGAGYGDADIPGSSRGAGPGSSGAWAGRLRGAAAAAATGSWWRRRFRAGMVFRLSPRGLGYYPDAGFGASAGGTVRRARAGPALAPELPAAPGPGGTDDLSAASGSPPSRLATLLDAGASAPPSTGVVRGQGFGVLGDSSPPV